MRDGRMVFQQECVLMLRGPEKGGLAGLQTGALHISCCNSTVSVPGGFWCKLFYQELRVASQGCSGRCCEDQVIVSDSKDIVLLPPVSSWELRGMVRVPSTPRLSTGFALVFQRHLPASMVSAGE